MRTRSGTLAENAGKQNNDTGHPKGDTHWLAKLPRCLHAHDDLDQDGRDQGRESQELPPPPHTVARVRAINKVRVLPRANQ